MHILMTILLLNAEAIAAAFIHSTQHGVLSIRDHDLETQSRKLNKSIKKRHIEAETTDLQHSIFHLERRGNCFGKCAQASPKVPPANPKTASPPKKASSATASAQPLSPIQGSSPPPARKSGPQKQGSRKQGSQRQDSRAKLAASGSERAPSATLSMSLGRAESGSSQVSRKSSIKSDRSASQVGKDTRKDIVPPKPIQGGSQGGMRRSRTRQDLVSAPSSIQSVKSGPSSTRSSLDSQGKPRDRSRDATDREAGKSAGPRKMRKTSSGEFMHSEAHQQSQQLARKEHRRQRSEIKAHMSRNRGRTASQPLDQQPTSSSGRDSGRPPRGKPKQLQSLGSAPDLRIESQLVRPQAQPAAGTNGQRLPGPSGGGDEALSRLSSASVKLSSSDGSLDSKVSSREHSPNGRSGLRRSSSDYGLHYRLASNDPKGRSSIDLLMDEHKRRKGTQAELLSSSDANLQATVDSIVTGRRERSSRPTDSSRPSVDTQRTFTTTGTDYFP